MQILENTKPQPTAKQKSDSFLVIENVSKVYETAKGPYVVLDNVNLNVKEGEFICVIGHSGCGKSTLLNMVAGFNQPTAGTVSVQGEAITEPGPERMVVFQNYSLLPWLTAKENILLGVQSVYPDKSADEQMRIVQENLELVGLTEAANKKPSQLSGGMKQRVSIARALATRPQVLILDEPFGALDPITREELQEELLSIWRHHQITVLMITHDIDEALFLADRLVMMTNGPSANVGEILEIPFERPRKRAKIMEDPQYYELRNYALDFLFRRFAHHDEDEDTVEETTEVAQTETTTTDSKFPEGSTIAPSSSAQLIKVPSMSSNKPTPEENPYTPSPDAYPESHAVGHDDHEMSPATKTGILFALWGVILATLVGSLLVSPTGTTANKEGETKESATAVEETETTTTVIDTASPSPTLSPSPTVTLSPSATTSPSPASSSSLTLSPSTTASPSPSPAATLSPSSSLTLSPSTPASPSPSPAATLSPSPSSLGTTTATSPSPSPSPTATLSPSPSSLGATTLSPSSPSPSPTGTAGTTGSTEGTLTLKPSPTATSSPLTATTTPSPSATTATTSGTTSSTTSSTPTASELQQLNQTLYDQINQAWQTTPVTAESVYTVSVDKTGKIIDYQPKSPQATQNAQNTPLPTLTKSNSSATPYAQFEVTFTTAGTLEVNAAR